MRGRLADEALAAALVACSLTLSTGCVESRYVWSLNPSGTGKVEVDARVQPVGTAFRGRGGPFGAGPEEIAKALAREVLRKSRGVAAWTDVSSGIADDGRVIFRGTAYFDDLARVRIEGDPFPSSTFKPSLARGADARLVVGLDIDDRLKRCLPCSGELYDLPEAATEDEDEAANTRAKIAYQRMKPFLTGVLSTMHTETVVRVPGEVVETSNYRRRGEGTVGLVFDGSRALQALDELALHDAVEWQRIVGSLRDDADIEGTRSNEEFRSRLAEVAFGERGPVRAVVEAGDAAEGRRLFDYDSELAGITDARREILGPSWLGPESGDWSLRSTGGAYWRLSGGPVACARTDLGTGTGWTGIVAGGGGFLDLYMQIEVSRVEYEDSDGVRTELHRATLGGGGGFGPVVVGGGLGFSFGPGDIWATGPQVSCGFGAFGRHAEIYVAATGYAWIGERDDEFDFDLEGDVRLAAGVRF